MTKVPVWNRDLLAGMLGLDETLIRVHAIDAGGGFGVRGEFYPEDFLIPWLAARLGRPVKWAEDRAEHLMAVNHSRQQYHRIAAAFDADGRITGLDGRHRARQRRLLPHARGRGARTDGGDAARALPDSRLPGPGAGGAHQQDAVRHLPGAGPVRGHGGARAPARRGRHPARPRPDRAARAQSAHQRTRCRTSARSPPCGTDLVLDTGDYPALLAAAAKEADRLGYRTAGRAAADRRARPRGFGLAMFVEKSGLGPQETADVTVSKSGAVHVLLRRHLAGSGHRDRARADRRGRARRRPASRPRHGGRHGRPAVRGRVLGVAVDRGRRQRGAPGRYRGAGAGGAAGRADARGRRGGPRTWPTGRSASAATRPRGSTLADIARAAEPTSGYLQARRAGRAVGPPPLRGLPHDLSVRRARRRRRGGLRDRAGPGAALPGGLRGGPRDQPDAGGGPAEGRRGPGDRRRAVRGVQLRRGRPAAGDHVHRVPDADRGGGTRRSTCCCRRMPRRRGTRSA